MKRFTSTLALALALLAPLAHAAQLPVPAAEEAWRNYLKNPGAEQGKAGVTWSGGATKTADATAVAEGTYGFDWDSNGAAQTMIFDAITIPAGLKGRNGVAWCMIKAASGSPTHTIVVDDGTNALVTAQTISTTTNGFTKNTLNFIFPTSGSVRLKITSVASDEPAIYIDSCYLGDAANLTAVSQAQLVASGYYPATTNCDQSSSSTSPAALGTDADCPGPTVEFNPGPGVLQTTDNNTASAFTVNSLPPGYYRVSFRGTTYMSTNNFVAFSINDGTTTSPALYKQVTTATDATILFAYFRYTTTANRTFTVYADVDGNTVHWDASTTGRDTYFTLEKMPDVSETAFRPEMLNWRVDANISGANPSLGTSDQTSYTGIEDTALTLANNTGAGVLTAQIPCSTTVAPSGTTCSSGNESVGVVFTLPVAGDVRACVSFGHKWAPTDSDELEVAFEIVETPTNAQTISQEGKSRVEVGGKVPGTSGMSGAYVPVQVCGTFTFSSAGQKALRLFYEQDVTSVPSSNVIVADASSTVGQRDIHWEVYPINQSIPAPVLLGGASFANASTPMKGLTAVLNCDSSSAITSQNGSTSEGVATIGNIATGVCAGTFAGMWSSTTGLACHADIKGSTVDSAARVDPTSTTAFNLYCYTPSTGAALSTCDVSLTCWGPR